MAARKTAPRKRDAAATRAAILVSARRAFAASGYDGAGVREIASGAGVTAMLINRYFGSKEQLFAEVVAETMRGATVLTAEVLRSPDAGARIAAGLVELTKAGATPLDGFLIMHRSGSSARAAEIGRAEIEKRYTRVLAPALGGAQARERAAVMISLIAGFQVMRQMIGLPALTEAKPKALARLMAPLFQRLMEGAGS